MAVFQTTDVADPEILAIGHVIFGLLVKLTSMLRFAGGNTSVALSKVHSNTM